MLIKLNIYILLQHTGSPLRAASRIQMNALLKRIPEVDIMAKFPNVLAPAIWIDEVIELCESTLKKFLKKFSSLLFSFSYCLTT